MAISITSKLSVQRFSLFDESVNFMPRSDTLEGLITDPAFDGAFITPVGVLQEVTHYFGNHGSSVLGS